MRRLVIVHRSDIDILTVFVDGDFKGDTVQLFVHGRLQFLKDVGIKGKGSIAVFYPVFLKAS